MAASSHNLLLVDDEPAFRNVAAKHFRRHGYRVSEADNGDQALQLASKRHFEVAAVDIVISGVSGIEVLKRLRSDSGCQVVMVTGQGTIDTAVEAMKLGAYDFLSKPVRLPAFQAVIDGACQAGRLPATKRFCSVPNRPADMIGESPQMQDVYRMIERAGPAQKPILIEGETGTGKEFVARALHQASSRANQSLVVFNCAALSETLLESELFGHERGAFTGATTAVPGLFESADKGTMFIDEIGEMPLALQAKLLRILEDGSLRRVGGVKERHVDVRILTATNRDLVEEVKIGRFRQDLYYRINVMKLTLPPLRARGTDIPLLARHLAGARWKIDKDAMHAICCFPWPGNVRQLRNAIERAKILADDHRITASNLPPEVATCGRESNACSNTLTADLQTLKREAIERVMKREHGNKARAARALGVSRRSLYRLLERHTPG